jgi:hypothetical protein
MALHDLVSPWAAAIDAAESPRTTAAFRQRHAVLLESLRVQRAPHDRELTLAADPALLHRLAARVADPEWQQRFRDILARAAQLGADVPSTLVLLAGDGSGDPGEPLPLPQPTAVLFVESGDDVTLGVGLGRSLAALTRWCAADSVGTLRPGDVGSWDRWARARELPLAESAYLEGVGLHLAAALFPALEPRQLLGITRGALQRLRERERLLRTLLAADLPEASLGLVLRWLAPGAPPSARTVNDVVIPAAAGRYLAWRMTAARVARVGLAEALRMPADIEPQ